MQWGAARTFEGGRCKLIIRAGRSDSASNRNKKMSNQSTLKLPILNLSNAGPGQDGAVDDRLFLEVKVGSQLDATPVQRPAPNSLWAVVCRRQKLRLTSADVRQRYATFALPVLAGTACFGISLL
jgi:hypothetical protein